ncbi:LuxR C-terminal-related transcriptional regulator [Cryobacterium sp. AP23]
MPPPPASTPKSPSPPQARTVLPDPDTAEFPLPLSIASEPGWYLHRPRLDALLERLRAPDARIIALWDAAGSGKTTLMAGWARGIRAANGAVDWISAADLGDAPDAVQIMRSLRAAASIDAGGSDPRFVFVDDLHLAETSSPTGAADLTRLLEELAELPADMRIVVSGRHRPGAGSAPLEAAGVLIECPEDTLAFTLEETLALAAHHDIDLSAQDAAALWQHTGGWATGVSLALTWRRTVGETLDLKGFDGDNPAVSDYLAAEIVTDLDAGDREVLLHAALSEVVALDLAVAVSERTDAGDVLERLARRNTLIARDRAGEGETGYRYHPILLAYLQAEGRRRDSSAATARHLLASRWHSDRAHGAAALEQSLLAHDPLLADELLERFGLGLVLTGATDLVDRALSVTHGRVVSPATVCLRVLLAPLSGPGWRAPHQLLQASAAMAALLPGGRGGKATTTRWGFVLETLWALYASERSDVETRLRTLQDPSASAARQDLFVDLLAALAEGRCLDRLGRSGQAEDVLRDVAESAREGGLDWLFLQASDLAATAAGHAGNWLHVAMLEGEMAAAATRAGAVRPFDHATSRAVLYSMIQRYERCQPVDPAVLAELAAAETEAGVKVPAEVLLLMAQFDNSARARQALDRLMLLMREVGAEHPRALSLCCVPLIEVSGSLDGRSETSLFVRLIERALGEDSLEAVLVKFLLVPPTRAGHPAEERLRGAALEERTAWRGSTIVTAWIALAHVADVSGRHVESDARLLRALRLSSRIGAERAFLAGGGQGVSLIRGRLGRLGDLDEYARHVLRCADSIPEYERPQAQDRSHNTPALTPRERDLLRELPFHQSVADIARSRNVSPNTVKTHLRNIYQKLDAANRADAVAIAQDRGLL